MNQMEMQNAYIEQEVDQLLSEGYLPIKVINMVTNVRNVNREDVKVAVDQWNEWQRRILHCERTDHIIKGTSHVGPESGSEDFYCTRCGWSHSIIYY